MTPLHPDEQGAVIKQFGGNRRNLLKWLRKNCPPGIGCGMYGKRLVTFKHPYKRFADGTIVIVREE